MNTIKKYFIPGVIVIFAIAILIIVDQKTKNNVSTNNTGTIEIVIIDKEGTESRQSLSFDENDTLRSLLEENYTILIKDGMLLKIDDMYTPDTSKYFIKIFINDVPSSKGLLKIELKDKDIYKFVYTKTNT